MVPLLVEYSEDDNAGCGFGMIILTGLVLITLVLVRATRGVPSLQRRP